jgi:hypothetical protein
MEEMKKNEDVVIKLEPAKQLDQEQLTSQIKQLNIEDEEIKKKRMNHMALYGNGGDESDETGSVVETCDVDCQNEVCVLKRQVHKLQQKVADLEAAMEFYLGRFVESD